MSIILLLLMLYLSIWFFLCYYRGIVSLISFSECLLLACNFIFILYPALSIIFISQNSIIHFLCSWVFLSCSVHNLNLSNEKWTLFLIEIFQSVIRGFQIKSCTLFKLSLYNLFSLTFIFRNKIWTYYKLYFQEFQVSFRSWTVWCRFDEQVHKNFN
jgi:hypothetical protein